MSTLEKLIKEYNIIVGFLNDDADTFELRAIVLRSLGTLRLAIDAELRKD